MIDLARIPYITSCFTFDFSIRICCLFQIQKYIVIEIAVTSYIHGSIRDSIEFLQEWKGSAGPRIKSFGYNVHEKKCYYINGALRVLLLRLLMFDFELSGNKICSVQFLPCTTILLVLQRALFISLGPW